MGEVESLFLVGLLRHFEPKNWKNQSDKIGLTIPSGDLPHPLKLLNWSKDFLLKIHHSWYEEVFSSLSRCEQIFLSRALPAPQAAVIRERFHLVETESPVDFLFSRSLFEKMEIHDKTPIPLIPPSSLSCLLDFGKDDLVSLISLLPIPYLAPQFKRIIDKKRLLNLYNLLSEEQKLFLKESLQKRKLAPLTSLDLPTWKGSPSELAKQIHRLGIDLLAKGLEEESKDLPFYLSRILGVERGKLLLTPPRNALPGNEKEILLETIKFFRKG